MTAIFAWLQHHPHIGFIIGGVFLLLIARTILHLIIRYRNRPRRLTDDEDQYHCARGPAVVKRDGTKEWYWHGRRHRIGGPALVYGFGDKEWYVNGQRHREDGPAIEADVWRADSYYRYSWYLEGVFYGYGKKMPPNFDEALDQYHRRQHADKYL